MKIQHNPPAFPVTQDNSGETWNGEGLTMRDYFAAKAMHKFLTGSILPIGYDASEDFAIVSQRAYEMADAMLEARK